MLRARRGDAAFLAAGLLATAAQVLLLRELMTDVAGDETAVGIGLAAWFAGVGAGAALARRSARARHPAASLAALAVLPVVGIVLGRLLRAALAPDPGELPGLALTLGLALATLAPAGAAVGTAFTALAAGTQRGRPGLAVARLYVVESLGSLAGGLLVTWLAGVHLLPLRLAALTGAAAGALALAGLAQDRRALVLASLLCAAALLCASPLDRWSEAVRFSGVAGGVPLVASADTPYQHLAVGGEAVRHLYASGQYAASFPDPYAAETLGNLVALLAPSPRRVLLAGGVERGLVPVLLRHGVDHLTLLEPDAGALAFLEPMLPQEDRAALRDRRVRVAASDPRA
jgi:predicted membrane-bound spermidine synthase